MTPAPTLAQALAAYRRALKSRTAATQRTYGIGLQRFATFLNDPAGYAMSRGARLIELPADALEDFYLDLLTEALAPATRRVYLAAARGFVSWAAAHDKLPPTWPLARALDNLKGVMVADTAYHSPRVNGEAEAIAQAVIAMKLPRRPAERLRALRDRALILTLYSTGIRRQEACELNQADLDFELRRAIVCGKGDKERTVFFSVEAEAALRAYLGGRPEFHGPLVPVFVTHPGNQRISGDVVRQTVERVGKLAGVKWHPHGFRHAFARRLLSKGLNPHQIQALLGHASVTTTMKVYAAYTVEDLQRAYEDATGVSPAGSGSPPNTGRSPAGR